MKKGRHRRFEEARAMKRDNGDNTEEDYLAWLNDPENVAREHDDDDEDPYAKYAEKYADDDESDIEETK